MAVNHYYGGLTLPTGIFFFQGGEGGCVDISSFCPSVVCHEKGEGIPAKGEGPCPDAIVPGQYVWLQKGCVSLNDSTVFLIVGVSSKCVQFVMDKFPQWHLA